MQLIYHIIIFTESNSFNGFINRSHLLGMSLIIRNFIWLLCTLIIPFAKYNNELLAACNETKDCARRLELALCSKQGYLYFTSYVESLSNDHKDIIHLFTLLIIMKEKKREGDDCSEVKRDIITLYNVSNSAKEIFEEAKYSIRDNNYDKIIPTVMQRLNEYFKDFIKSEYYSELRKKLSLKEIINERLKLADLI